MGILPLALSLATDASAARLVEGTFLATRECPAFVSKIQQTNPDDARLVPGRIYPLFEVNQDPPDYYRIRMDDADPKERWVAADCGEYPPKSSPAQFAEAAADLAGATRQCAPRPPGGDACRTCGKADSYVLALYWYPGYCETQREHLNEHPECRNSDPYAYSAGNFTLHELRPIQRRCKKEVGYCGTVDHEMTPFSAYPPLELAETSRQALDRIMPGVMDGSGRERHEWYKHGTCSGFPAAAYFKLAGTWVEAFNQSGMAEFMAENLGKQIRREEFFKRIESSLGAGARKHVNIECSGKGKMLLGVAINLPSDLSSGADLKSLIRQAPRAGSGGNCGSRIVIDAAGLDSAGRDLD